MPSKTFYITQWIKNYFAKNGPNAKAVIGVSGGKDSTVAAALCVRALGKDRVLGVLMPQDVQYDIDDSRRVCELLGIQSIEVDIGPACDRIYKAIDEAVYDNDATCRDNSMVATNTPARIRMTTLYAVAAMVGGRVCNTSNASEVYVGYSTKWGDGVGDFAPLRDFTVGEVLEIGHALGLPKDLVEKTPEDGLSGKTDEENMGIRYEDIDNVVRDHVHWVNPDAYQAIEARHRAAAHKANSVNIEHPSYHEWRYLD